MDALRRTFNLTSPFALVVGFMLLVVALGALGFRFDPLNLTAKRANQAEAAAVVSQDDASARRLESAGAADTAQRIDRITVQIRAADDIAHRSALAAQDAPDAHLPLDPARLDRLRLADEQLCQLSPAVCYDLAAATVDARAGRPPLPPSPPA
ncbi:MAG: hypothetical protein IE910_05950 [Brevundimonas sp.]|nr:hypothetical protein [Brevundimonas sp.]